MPRPALRPYPRVFQALAEVLAARYGVELVHAHVLDTYDPPLYTCTFALHPSQLPETGGWDESAEAESMAGALDNLELALRHHAAHHYFSPS